jgi:hypothetical protein
MANGNTPGILGQYGLNLDEEAILKAQRQEQQAQALGFASSLGLGSSSERGAANIGALLGARISKPEGLTSDQQRRVAAAKAAEERTNEWRKQNASADVNEQQTMYKRYLGEEAFRAGLPDVGAQIMSDLDTESRARRLQDMQFEKLGYDVEEARYGPDRARAALASTEQQTLASMKFNQADTVFEFGEQDPNKGVSAFIDEQGNAIMYNPDGSVREVKPIGTYTRLRPDRPTAGRGGAGYGTPTEYKEVRASALAVLAKGEVMGEMKGLLQESYDKNGNLALMGRGGRIVGAAGRISNDIYNVMSHLPGAGGFTAVDKNGDEYSIDTASGRKKFERQNAAKADDYLSKYLPVGTTPSQVERYRALMTELMYIEARSQESGARQFSDADIERAAAMVGDAVNNPGALQQILGSSYMRAFTKLENLIEMYDPKVHGEIITRDTADKLYTQKRSIQETWLDKPWGTAMEPGPGITDKPSAAPATPDPLEYFLGGAQ